MSPILSVVIIGAFQYKSNSNYACTRMISQLCYLVGKEISIKSCNRLLSDAAIFYKALPHLFYKTTTPLFPPRRVLVEVWKW